MRAPDTGRLRQPEDLIPDRSNDAPLEEAGVATCMVNLDGAKAFRTRNLACWAYRREKTSLEVRYGGGIKTARRFH